MKRTAVSIIFLLLLGMGTVSAQTLTVDYVDGYLDILDEGSWVELYIGESITARDTIRLDEDSYAELSGRGLSLSLTQAGTYRISDIIKANEEGESLGLSNMVSDKLQVLFQGDDTQTQSAVGGVRAAEAEAAPKLDWMGSDTAELIKESREAISEGRLDTALSLLEEAYDLALDEQEETEALFYRGYVHALKGENADALEYLTSLPPDSYSETYHSHILVAGNLYVSSFAYEAALEWFAQYAPDGAAFQDPATQQMIYLLTGIAHKQNGSAPQARLWLEKTVNLDGGSDTAASARELLKDL